MQSSFCQSIPPPVAGISEKEACAHVWCPGFYGCYAENTYLDSLALVARKAFAHGFNGMVTNKTVLNWLSPQGPLQRNQTEMLISQSSPERDIFVYF